MYIRSSWPQDMTFWHVTCRQVLCVYCNPLWSATTPIKCNDSLRRPGCTYPETTVSVNRTDLGTWTWLIWGHIDYCLCHYVWRGTKSCHLVLYFMFEWDYYSYRNVLYTALQKDSPPFESLGVAEIIIFLTFPCLRERAEAGGKGKRKLRKTNKNGYSITVSKI